MRVAKEKIQLIKKLFTIDNMFFFMLLVLVSLIIMRLTWVIHQPIPEHRYDQVRYLVIQSAYPDIKEKATVLLQQPSISYGQYLKLMQAYQMEHAKVRRFPAVRQD